MAKSLKLEYVRLSTKLQNHLLGLLKEGAFDATGKLPPEEELAAMLGVSRTLLRDVLNGLEREGYIIRRRKLGTYINQKALDIKFRADIEKEFKELLEDAGFDYAIGDVTTADATADEALSESLDVPIGEPLLKVTRTILSQGEPVIICKDFFRKSLIKNTAYTLKDLKCSIFDFLEIYCEKKIDFNITKIKPILPDPEIAKSLEIPEDQPIITMSDTGYTPSLKPVLVSHEFYKDGFFDFYVIRKKY